MNQEQLKRILEIVYIQHEKDKETQEKANAFLDCIGVDGQICTTSIAEQINKVICVINPDVADWISYFLWEVPWLQRVYKEPVIVRMDDKGWDVSTKELQISFILHYYATK